MKKIYSTLLILFFACVAHSQFGPQQIISSNTDRAYLSIPLDIDNDGFIDVLKSGVEEHLLQWHRNLDGLGNFGPDILISDTPVLYLSIEFIDLDSDGDNDILYLENNPRNVSWLENLDGSGNFGPPQLILDSPQGFIQSVLAKDMDNDGDLDLIKVHSKPFTQGIVWYENLDGMANFGTANIIIDNVEGVTSLVVEDLDNDGNLDLLSTDEELGPAKLIWYRNLGDVMFTEAIEIYQFIFSPSDWTSIYNIQYVDINTDGQKDIVITSHNDDVGTFYHWFENLDNQGNFGSIQELPKNGEFCDLDNDGDNDILSGEFLGDRIYWIENTDGLGAFTIERTISVEVDFLRSVHAADFNGDGLLDVVSASISDDKVAWYENTGILSVMDSRASRFLVFPNPTTRRMTINSSETISEILLYNTLAQKIDLVWTSSEVDLSGIEPGIYFLKIISTDGFSETHKVVKK